MQLKDGDKNPKVPPLPDSEVQEFFDRANGLSDEREAKALYSDWAPLYDSTIDHFGRYLAPDKLASLVAVEVADRHAPILDIACGTGLVGQALARFGFDNITGIDLSDRMIERQGPRTATGNWLRPACETSCHSKTTAFPPFSARAPSQ